MAVRITRDGDNDRGLRETVLEWPEFFQKLGGSRTPIGCLRLREREDEIYVSIRGIRLAYETIT